jgi:hypothetical protein
MSKSLLALAGGLALLAAGSGRAAPVEADPNQEYRVTPEAGAWMICAHCYVGPNAPALAHELVLMLRRRDHQPAYIFVKGEEERRQQEENIRHMHELCPDVPNLRIRHVRIEEQYAVLIGGVGGWPDIDSARRALDDVKRLKPPDDEKLMDVLTAIEPAGDGKGRVKKAPLNPFASSFVVHNPTIPQEAVDRSKPDPALKELNLGRPYNLLNCGHPWTLAVKEFQGAAVVQSRSTAGEIMARLGLGSRSDDLLVASAKQAEEVARVLREMKFDAYVLHTRFSSVVSVGAFDKPDDPRLGQLQRQLAGLKLGPIQCFAQPQPMQVPQF